MLRIWRQRSWRIFVTKFWIFTPSQLQKPSWPHPLLLLVRDLLNPCQLPTPQLLHKPAILHHLNLHSQQASPHLLNQRYLRLNQPLQLPEVPQ